MIPFTMSAQTRPLTTRAQHERRAGVGGSRTIAGTAAASERSAMDWLETWLLLGAPRPLGSRIAWLQLPKNLLLLAVALTVMFVLGHQELIAGNLWLTSLWWLVVPLLIGLIAFHGLRRIACNGACLHVAPTSPPVLPQGPVADVRLRDLAQRPRAREAIP